MSRHDEEDVLKAVYSLRGHMALRWVIFIHHSILKEGV
jgi:hypothetical protein